MKWSGAALAPTTNIMYLYDSLGRRHKATNLAWVEQVIKLKKKSASNPWPVIEACFNFWAQQSPTRYNSFLVSVDNTRQTRKDPKFASTYDKVHGAYLRYTLDIPQEVMLMIRCVYNTNELPMDRQFFLEFAKRFPNLKVAQKL